MKKTTLVSALGMLLFCIHSVLMAGQNSAASIRIDLNYTTLGDQGQTSIPPPGIGVSVRLEIHIHGASNLDTYELNLNYPSSDLTFNSGAEDNAVSEEDNFLKKNGGSTVGFMATNNGTYINITNSLVGNQGEVTPDGDGLLAYVRFTTKVASPGNLTFGTVTWYDNNGNIDICSDKGQASLPVTMSNMYAESTQEGVIVSWTTASQVNCAGFHILRSDSPDGEYQRITTSLIAGSGSTSSSEDYQFTDKNVQNQTYWYQIEEISTEGGSITYGPLSIQAMNTIPEEYKLSQNYPNPFNPITTINYQLPETSHITLGIYNQLGQEIMQWVFKNQQAGFYTIDWNGTDKNGQLLTSGIYIVRMQANDFNVTRKVTFLR